MKHLTTGLMILLLVCFACGKKEIKPKTTAKIEPLSPGSELKIWGLEKLRTLGFEQTVSKDFADKYNCRVQLRLFENIVALLDTLKAEPDSSRADLILGIDNAFAMDESLLSMFHPIADVSSFYLSRDLMPDPQKRLIPYGYANLGVIYNTHFFAKGPQSFGELQDARFFRQMGICDPYISGEGRGTLYWSLALFGSAGYQTLWKSIRKNIRDVYPNYEAGIDALKSGKINMLIGYSTSSVWMQESQQTDKSLQFKLLREGSWQYSEHVGIPLTAMNYSSANAFIRYLLSTDAQMMVLYKLGLFPANSRTMLPERFARIPISSFIVNQRLKEPVIQEELPGWLEFWHQLFIENVYMAD